LCRAALAPGRVMRNTAAWHYITLSAPRRHGHGKHICAGGGHISNSHQTLSALNLRAVKHSDAQHGAAKRGA